MRREFTPAVMNEFREAVRRCGRVSSGESLELGDLARRQVSAFGLLPHEVAEEFFKPALDCGVWVSHGSFATTNASFAQEWANDTASQIKK